MSQLKKIDNELRKYNERLSILLSEDATTVDSTPFSFEFRNYCNSIVQIAQHKKPNFPISIRMSGVSTLVVDFRTEKTQNKMTLTKYKNHISETYFVLNTVSGNHSESTFNYDNESSAAANVKSSITTSYALSLEDKENLPLLS